MSYRYQTSKPVSRSKLRMTLGRIYFTWRRYWQWTFNRSNRYALSSGEKELAHGVAAHKTPLYRRLRHVDMWLQENKAANLKLACGKINKILVKPGETFSFWRLVGKPTQAKGYRKGMVLTNGSFTAGVGGGLCQLSNLIYWMTLHTPLTVTERWRHTHDVFPDANRTQPFGSGATVVYNYVDLQIRNDTPYEYQLLVSVGDNDLEGEWRCEHPSSRTFQIYESQHLIKQEWWGAYTRHNVIKRKTFDLSGGLLADEFVTENHALMMYEPLLQAGEESDTTPSTTLHDISCDSEFTRYYPKS